MSRILIVLGAVLILLGLSWSLISRLPLGRLPGDLLVEKKNFVFYFPLATSILLSVLLSAVLWFLSRR